MNDLQLSAIQELSQWKAQEGSPVLSVYLNMDPAHPLNQRGGHKLILDQMLKDVESQIEDEGKLRHLLEDAEWVRQKLEFHLPKGKSFVLFCDVSGSLYFEEDLPIRMPSQAWFGDTPYVRPLLQARDEFERYGVVLADRERARFFVISTGNIQEVSDIFQSPPVKHRKTSGSDHMRSQMIFQRRAAKWSGWFLKDVSDRLHEIIKEHDIDRVILAGPEEVTAELQRLLPKAVDGRVVDRLRISVTAREKEILELAFPVIERIENERERTIVEDLITTASKSKPKAATAVLGFNGTLDAINQGRVLRLVYPVGLKMKGYQCPSCDVLLDHATQDGKCPYCQKPLEEIEDMIWLAAERVLSMGGKIEEVRSEAMRTQLNAAGKLGAFLR